MNEGPTTHLTEQEAAMHQTAYNADLTHLWALIAREVDVETFNDDGITKTSKRISRIEQLDHVHQNGIYCRDALGILKEKLGEASEVHQVALDLVGKEIKEKIAQEGGVIRGDIETLRQEQAMREAALHEESSFKSTLVLIASAVAAAAGLFLVFTGKDSEHRGHETYITAPNTTAYRDPAREFEENSRWEQLNADLQQIRQHQEATGLVVNDLHGRMGTRKAATYRVPAPPTYGHVPYPMYSAPPPPYYPPAVANDDVNAPF